MNADESTAAPAAALEAPNFGMPILAGVIAMLVGAALWAAVTVATNSELGLMAIAVGLIVGFSIRKVRKVPDRRLGVLGAVLAFAGCVLGNAASLQVFIAQKFGIPYGQAFLSPDIPALVRAMSVTFQPIDLLFYAIAIYEGYKFSSR